MLYLSRTFVLAAGLAFASFIPAKAQIVSDEAVIIFTANDGVHGRELWVTDGTHDGTVLLADINEGPDNSMPQWLTATEDGRVFFQANNGRNGAELWVTDGTSDGTRMVRDIRDGPEGSSPSSITYIGNGRVVFSARTDEAGRETWISDGTFLGTFQLLDSTPGPDNGSPRNFTRLSESTFMFGAERNEQRRIWVSDGTPEGTTMVPGPLRDMIEAAPIDDTAVVINATHPNRGRHPWIYDLSTGDRPELLRRINNVTSSNPRSFTQLANGSLIFQARHHARGIELFITDGTRGGTKRVKDLARGPASSSPRNFTPLTEDRDIFVFRTVGDAAEGVAPGLWRTDGTGSGTQRLKNRLEVTEIVRIADGLVVFRGFDRRNENTMSHGATPWVTDGTREGTRRITRTNRQGTSHSQNFAAIGGGLAIFSSRSGNRGDEPYITDGTAEGTFRLKDINPGAASSSPSFFTPLAVMKMP